MKSNAKIEQALVQAHQNNRLHHALLLTGDSADKFNAALCFARYLLCLAKDKQRFCGQCKSCQQFEPSQQDSASAGQAQQHPDCFILGDVADESPGINDIREIISFLSLTPHFGQKKVVVINAVERLNIPSQNALLKILEEPPSYGQFVLITENKRLLQSTILSRCLQYHFGGPSLEEALNTLKQVSSDLKANTSFNEQMLQAVVYLSNGNLESAKQWLESPVWQYQEALIDWFVLGNANESAQLQQMLNQSAQDALYFIYTAVSDVIKYYLKANTDDLYILNQNHLGRLAKKTNEMTYSRYLNRLQSAIRDLQQVAGMNKLLLFQDLHLFLMETTGAIHEPTRTKA